ALDPKLIERYLKANGWSQRERSDRGFSIWGSKSGKRTGRVWLPENDEFVDFNEGVARLVKDVASFEDRSQLEVFEDLNTIALGDVIRLTTFDPKNRESTTIPISDGLALVEKAKRITTAAALSTDLKRPVFSTYRPPTVAEYLENVRLGQTEKGSYKIKVI